MGKFDFLFSFSFFFCFVLRSLRVCKGLLMEKVWGRGEGRETEGKMGDLI